MEELFNSFCAFGAGKDAKFLMDNSKFAKMARDLKILDKKLTATDVDIIFNRPEVKSKSERKINYDQFRKALKLLAEKKYPGIADNVAKLEEKMLSGPGPASSFEKSTKTAGVVDRLTDTSKYTGSHKERFDESGKGKGLAGRKDFDKKAEDGYVGGYKNMDTYDERH